MDSGFYNPAGGVVGLSKNAPIIQMPHGGPDAAMGGVLEEPVPNGFENLPLSLDSQNLEDDDDDQIQRPFTNADASPVQHQNVIGMIPDSEDSAAETPAGGAGAGPLPTNFGAHALPSTGSTLTEFTKRRNWSQRVVDELQDFLHILTPDGRFVYVSPNTKALTGYEPSELLGKFIVELIHQDDSAIFVLDFNESIASGNPFRFFYRFRKPDGEYVIFESHGHPHLTSEAAGYGPNNATSVCRGFFMMARPYPTKNAAMLDSFLEHKIESQRLKRRIADLKREEAEEESELDRAWAANKAGGTATGGASDITPSTDDGDLQGASLIPSSDNIAMPPPAKPSIISTGNLLTRQNLEDANALARPDSINDKMARFEGATHIETIEMLTGLRYQDGERSHGISTGDSSPALIRGDAGIAIPIDKDRSGGQGGLNGIEKKKKGRIADEYVCTDCGTLDSPEWRKGPSGPKTLCNACGLRWAKKEKKKSTSGPSTTNHGMNPKLNRNGPGISVGISSGVK